LFLLKLDRGKYPPSIENDAAVGDTGLAFADADDD